MKKKFCLPVFSLMLMFMHYSSNAQIFPEVKEYGWGGGLTSPQPCFADLDNDGLIDMLCGCEAGTLLHYEQDTVFSYYMDLQSSMFNGIITDEESMPTVFDIDNDGMLDLLIGAYNQIWHYEQTVPSSYEFEFITDDFNGLSSTGNLLHPRPELLHIDDDGLVDMLLANFPTDAIDYYEQSESGTYEFNLVESNFNGIYAPHPSYFAVGHVDGNQQIDILTSPNWDKITHYEQVAPHSLNFELVNLEFFDDEIDYETTYRIPNFNEDTLADLVVSQLDGKFSYYEEYILEYQHFAAVNSNLNNSVNASDPVPHAIDIDGDGLLDILIGKYQSILHYEQASEGGWNFNLIDDNFNNIYNLGDARLCCHDIDNDGLLDLLVGNYDLQLSHYEQASPNSYNFYFVSDNFCNIYIGQYDYLMPLLYDLDSDGKLDLVVGSDEDNHLVHYEQDTENSLNFEQVYDQISGLSWDMSQGGIEFCHLNDNNKLDALVAGYNTLKYFEEENPGTLHFILVEYAYSEIWGSSLYPEIADIDFDNKLDLLLGNEYGQVSTYEQDTALLQDFQKLTPHMLNTIDVGFYAAPVLVDINNDGLLDMLTSSFEGTIWHYIQTDTASMQFDLETEAFSGIDIGMFTQSSLETTDLNGNGLIDLLAGVQNGKLKWYEQESQHSFNFLLVTNALSNINVGSDASPAIADINGDGLLDLLIGKAGGSIAYYVQEAANSEYFSPVSTAFCNIDVGNNAAPDICDIYEDGILDLVVGNSEGEIKYFIQLEPNSLEFEEDNSLFADLNVSANANPDVMDVDGDGMQDIVVGKHNGGVNLYRQEIDTQFSDFYECIEGTISVLPNPANDFIFIKSDYPIDQITWQLGNGQLLYTKKVSGMSCQINVSGFEQGIYILKIDSNNRKFYRKVLVFH